MPLLLSYLNQQKQWNDEKDIQHVVNDLNNNEQLVTTLHLTGNSIGVKAAEGLTMALSKQSKIDKLWWSDLFTGRGKDQIGTALKALSLGLMTAKVQLVELDLSDNAFGPNGVVGVIDLIASPCCYTLKVLNMNNQGLGHQGCKALVKAMQTARINSDKKGLNLEVFIAGRNRLENEGMGMLSEVFGDGMDSLRKVVLLQNGIGIHGIQGIERLIRALRNHRNLQILNISDNTVKADGMHLLSELIPEFEHLEELYMDDCLLRRQGANIFSLIAEDKTICPNLKIISLSGNEIKGNAAMSIVSALIEGKPAIEKIDLRENEIKKTIVKEMFDLLNDFAKGHVLAQEEEGSDDEYISDEEDDSGDDTDYSDEVNSKAVEDSEEDEDEEEGDSNKDEYGYGEEDEEECDDEEEEVNESKDKESEGGLFGISKATDFKFGGLFGTPNASTSKNAGLFGTPNASTSNNAGLFGTPNASTSNNVGLFGTPNASTSNNAGLFGTPNASTPNNAGLFGTPKVTVSNNTGLFGTPNASTSNNAGLFGTPNGTASNNAGLFGTPNASTSNNACLFGTPNAFTPNNAGLFGTPKVTVSNNTGLFGTPNASTSNNAGLFGTPNGTASNNTGLFGTPNASTSNNVGLFGTRNAADTKIGGLFGSTNSPVSNIGGLFGTSNTNARTNLFSTNSNTPSTIFGNGGQSFSFTVAAKPEGLPLPLKNSIISGLESDSLMTIDGSTLKIDQAEQLSAVIDNELKSLSESKPDNAIRIGLILCEETNSFELGAALITHLLTSATTWSQSTNAMLVEMNCIKSEEKKFVPFCTTNAALPIKVLKKMLAVEHLSNEVKMTLSVILKNLSKTASSDTDDLLRELDSVMTNLSI